MTRSTQKMTVRIEPDGALISVVGRNAWMLRRLIDAGSHGLTSIEAPAPRNSHYVMKLRQAGLIIETVDEKHDGPYSGVHGRYFLRSQVRVVAETEVAHG